MLPRKRSVRGGGVTVRLFISAPKYVLQSGPPGVLRGSIFQCNNALGIRLIYYACYIVSSRYKVLQNLWTLIILRREADARSEYPGAIVIIAENEQPANYSNLLYATNNKVSRNQVAG